MNGARWTLMLALLGLTACRRHPAVAPAPAVAVEEHCWWTLLRTPLAPDSVAAAFVRAYGVAGLTGATTARRGDTVWVSAGPTRLLTDRGPSYAARMVAYPSGDSTSFRTYASISPEPGATADAAERAPGYLDVCGRIASAVAFRWVKPARGPNAEDSLAVWTRDPARDDR